MSEHKLPDKKLVRIKSKFLVIKGSRYYFSVKKAYIDDDHLEPKADYYLYCEKIEEKEKKE